MKTEQQNELQISLNDVFLYLIKKKIIIIFSLILGFAGGYTLYQLDFGKSYYKENYSAEVLISFSNLEEIELFNIYNYFINNTLTLDDKEPIISNNIEKKFFINFFENWFDLNINKNFNKNITEDFDLKFTINGNKKNIDDFIHSIESKINNDFKLGLKRYLIYQLNYFLEQLIQKKSEARYRNYISDLDIEIKSLEKIKKLHKKNNYSTLSIDQKIDNNVLLIKNFDVDYLEKKPFLSSKEKLFVDLIKKRIDKLNELDVDSFDIVLYKDIKIIELRSISQKGMLKYILSGGFLFLSTFIFLLLLNKFILRRP